MFFNRLMGASQGNQGEIITQVKDNLWQSNRGTLYWLVEPDLCQSSTGVYYRKTGLNVYGSDGNWFSSLDPFDTETVTEAKTSPQKMSNATGAGGCLTVTVILVFIGVVMFSR